MLEIKRFRCYEAEIDEDEKADRWHILRCVTEAFSTICAVHIEECGGWWLSGCRSSVAEHWQLKTDVLGSIPGSCQPFHFLLVST